jgi:hypothetical protein
VLGMCCPEKAEHEEHTSHLPCPLIPQTPEQPLSKSCFLGDLALSCCCHGYSSAWPLPRTCAPCPGMTGGNPGHPTFGSACTNVGPSLLPCCLWTILHCLWVWLSHLKHKHSLSKLSPGSHAMQDMSSIFLYGKLAKNVERIV